MNEQSIEKIKYYDEKLEIFKNNDLTRASILFKKGYLLMDENNYVDAIKCFDECLKIDPKDIITKEAVEICSKKLDDLKEILEQNFGTLKMIETKQPDMYCIQVKNEFDSISLTFFCKSYMLPTHKQIETFLLKEYDFYYAFAKEDEEIKTDKYFNNLSKEYVEKFDWNLWHGEGGDYYVFKLKMEKIPFIG